MASCHAYVKERGKGSCFVLQWMLKMACHTILTVLAEMLNCKLMSIRADAIRHLYLHVVLEYTDSIMNSTHFALVFI